MAVPFRSPPVARRLLVLAFALSLGHLSGCSAPEVRGALGTPSNGTTTTKKKLPSAKKKAKPTTTPDGDPEVDPGTGGTAGGASAGNAGTSGTGGVGGASGAGGSTGSPATAGPPQDCVDTINRYRATLGRSPLQRWTNAESCTDGQAESDSSTGTAHGAFGQCREFAQNECPGWDGTPASILGDCLQMMWDEGPGGGHYDNMASDEYARVSCGFFTTRDGSVWAVQNFQ
ncbi:MAG: hypothetical protein U0169_15840 [Polyangiaceae bacterium]